MLIVITITISKKKGSGDKKPSQSSLEFFLVSHCIIISLVDDDDSTQAFVAFAQPLKTLPLPYVSC